MSFNALFFCQYWACWYYMVYCLIKLLAKSALAISYYYYYYYYYYHYYYYHHYYYYYLKIT